MSIFFFFKPNYRTTDHVFTLHTLIDKQTKRNKGKVFSCFVDLKKSPAANYLPSRTPTAPIVTGRSKKRIKDNNHPSNWLLTPLTIQKVRSIQVHQRWDWETEKKLLSQGHQTVKQPSLTQRGCCLHTDLKSLATLINRSLVTLIMFIFLALHIPYVHHHYKVWGHLEMSLLFQEKHIFCPLK
jgi:hypothetical protein